MKLVETTVTSKTVRMRFAEGADPTKPNEWIDFQVPIGSLTLPSETELGDPRLRRFALVQQAALRFVRDAISAEIQGISSLVESSPR